MRIVLLLLAMLALPALADAQTVWKWVDEQGVTHYSDRPTPGATKMELSVGGTGAATSTPPPSPPPSSRPSQRSGLPYNTIAITSPSEGESIVNTGGNVQVNVRLEPSLRPGHNLHLYLDGQRIEGAPNATSYSLLEMPRGEHTVEAVVTDRGGTRLQTSDRVTFHVRQTSIANPPVGPALRNPPRPRASNKLRSKQPSYADLGGARAATVDPRTNRPSRKP